MSDKDDQEKKKKEAEKKKKLNDNLKKLCNHWGDRKQDLKSWETTPDGRVQFHVLINYWGSHHAYLVFNEKVTQPEAEKVLDPILKKLADDNQKDRCSEFVNEVDRTKLDKILDADRTEKAND
jgi:hypothetical protein